MPPGLPPNLTVHPTLKRIAIFDMETRKMVTSSIPIEKEEKPQKIPEKQLVVLEEEEVVSFAELSRMFPQCADQTASASCTSRSSTAGMGTPISCQRGGAAAAASTPGSAGGMQFIPSSGKLA